MNKKKCIICGEEVAYVSGHFSRHLLEEHNMTLKDYVILDEYNGIAPICKCGLCEEEPVFNRGKFKDYSKGHTKQDKKKELYILKYGEPKCLSCGNIVEKWGRGIPLKYCKSSCRPSYFNQEKIKETIKEKYGVDNVFQIPEIIEKIQSKLDHTENTKKALQTLKDKGLKNFNPIKQRKTMLERYGVDHISKTKKFRQDASLRMIELNKKAFNTIKKYKDTELYYQSTYELDFLEECETLGMLHMIDNGHTYKLDNGKRTLTDFSIKDYNVEIEIKSKYVMERQGGKEILDSKRNAVEKTGSRYILILDKNYDEFDKFLIDTSTHI